MDANFYLDESGFVRKDWRKQREERQKPKQEMGFLQTVTKAARGVWSSIGSIWRPNSNNWKQGQSNKEVMPSANEQNLSTDNIPEKEVDKPKTAMVDERAPSESISTAVTIRIAAEMLSNPKQEDLRQPVQPSSSPSKPLSSADQTISKLFKEEDVHYRMTRLDGVDLYHIVVDRKRHYILNNRLEPVPLGVDISSEPVFNTIIRSIDQKEEKRARGILMTNQELELSEKARLNDLNRTMVSSVSATDPPSSSQTIPDEMIDESIATKSPVKPKQTTGLTTAQVNLNSYEMVEENTIIPPKSSMALLSTTNEHQLLQPMLRPEEHEQRAESEDISPLFSQQEALFAPNRHVGNQSILEINQATNPFICENNSGQPQRKTFHRSATSNGRSRRQVERPE